MLVNLAVLLIACATRWAGLEFEDWFVVGVAVAFFPGSIPLGTLLVVWLVKQGVEPVQFRPISDERMVHVHAHPEFRRAVLTMADTDHPISDRMPEVPE
jgi:hypothetical protein